MATASSVSAERESARPLLNPRVSLYFGSGITVLPSPSGDSSSRYHAIFQYSPQQNLDGQTTREFILSFILLLW